MEGSIAEVSTTEAVIEETKHEATEEIKKKRIRHRKKALYKAIRDQMEFYFSDANLSKDRFMQRLLEENPEVDIETFTHFHKLQALTEDVKDIVKALKDSSVLIINKLGTKVSRVTPFVPKSQEEIDNCTIYVENLPSDTTHEHIKCIFEKFGNVVYVSLPKFKENAKIKGFAFVEFTSPDSVTSAVQAYSTVDGHAALENNPANLCSIQTFSATTNTINIKQKSGKLLTDKQQKEDEEETIEEPQKKKQKIEVEESAEKESGLEEGDKKTKKKRKRNKAHVGTQNPVLRVLSKKDWKKLRNKYLDLQRKSIRQLRKTMEQNVQQSIKTNKDAPTDSISEKISEIDESQSGLIVKITLDTPIVDAKRFKNQVKNLDGVCYVEAKDNDVTAFVRCNDSDAAKQLLEKHIWNQADILAGEEERNYWKKIEEGRQKKREHTTRTGSGKSPSKKAKINLTKQSERKHIRFDEED